jgi:hypothetical protein
VRPEKVDIPIRKVSYSESKSRRFGGKLKKEAWNSKISANFTYFGIIALASHLAATAAPSGERDGKVDGSNQKFWKSVATKLY